MVTTVYSLLPPDPRQPTLPGLLGSATDDWSLQWKAAVLLGYSLMLVGLMLSWTVVVLAGLAGLTSIPGGWLLMLVILLGGISAAPFISRLLFQTTIRSGQAIWARIHRMPRSDNDPRTPPEHPAHKHP